MLKKGLLGLVVVGLLGTFVFGREAVSYVRAGFNNIRNAVKAEVPVKFEIERAQTLVDQLAPDIRQCMHSVAEQQVDVENLRTALAQKEAELDKQKDAILALRADMGSGKSTFVYASHSYTASDVKRDLTSRFERFKAAESVLSADRQILAAREKTLVANREKLDNLMKSRKEIEVQLEQLQARANTVSAAEALSHLAIDDSNLSQARKLIADLNKQLDVQQRMLDVEGKFVGLIPVENTDPVVASDIDQQIDAYFTDADVAPTDSSMVYAE